jgi:hypothetical protein
VKNKLDLCAFNYSLLVELERKYGNIWVSVGVLMYHTPVACLQELYYCALGQTAFYTGLTSTCACTCMLRLGAVKGPGETEAAGGEIQYLRK